MKLAIKIAQEVCDWYGVNPQLVVQSKLSDDPDVDRNEKMALSLICHFYSHTSLRDLQMDAGQIARYFGMPELKVIKALNQRDYWQINSGSYAMVKRKIETLMDNYLIKIYE